MRRRSRAGSASVKSRRRKAATPKRRSARAAPRRSSSAASEEAKAAHFERERDEAMVQLAAATEVLGVISNSSGELDLVFDTILRNATRICEATFGNLWLCEGDSFRIAATHGAPSAYREYLKREPVVEPSAQSDAMARIASTKKPFQIEDLTKIPTLGSRMRMATIKLAKARTLVVVPMVKGNELIGVIAIYRQEVRPFTDKQIELLTHFAAQAVIAIENTRLLNELRQRTGDLSESLARQTATSEVLGVISSSPGDLKPVFEAMLTNATRLCEAKFGLLYLYEEGKLRFGAAHDVPPAFAEARGRGPFSPAPDTAIGGAVTTKQAVQVADLAATQSYSDRNPVVVAAVEVGGVRTALSVPMLKANALIGVITIYRKEVRPFTDKQIALVTNFAAQAVIAIENARLLNELRQRTDDLSETLEQQTATAQV